MLQSPYQPGQFLLAMPGIGDDRFEQSVIAMCSHDPGGAMGICLHEPLDSMTVPDLMRQLDIDPRNTPPLPVLAGGPMEPERGFVLHSPDWGGQDTRHVAGRWALTGSCDVLAAIAQGRGPTRWVAALGYAGWSPGQLERELSWNGWFVTPGTVDLIWNVEPELRWLEAYRTAGIDARMLSAEMGHA